MRIRHFQAIAFVFYLAGSVTVSAQTSCVAGMAGAYACLETDLESMMTPTELGGANSSVDVNDVWGWTDPQTGKEYALVGREDGAAFVDISDPVNPVLVANMPTNTNPSIWRDLKVYQDHAYVVADGAGLHGMQVFDLTRLRSIVTPGEVVTPDTVYTEIGSSHNIVINEATGFAYAVGSGAGSTVGSSGCAGGLHMIDISDPLSPTFVGCQTDASVGRGYTHDAQCVIYAGPDTEHQGKEICFNANESGVNIADVTTKSAPTTISFASYPSSAYVHQGWLTEDHAYYYQNDEGDERGAGLNTRTLIWDMADLDDPVLVKAFDQGTINIDHNLYIRGDLVFQANYTAGLRVFDITDRANPVLTAFFDTWPASDATTFDGAWSNYPFFASGNILISSSNGLFVVRSTVLADVDEPSTLPESLISASVYPNPFAETATVQVQLRETENVEIVVYDLLGREIARLFDGVLVGGSTTEFAVDDVDLPAGRYVVNIVAESTHLSRSFVKLR